MGRDEFDARMQIQLPLVLASVAGSVDVIGLVSFKLFTAHITGNLVLIADQLVRAGPPKVDEVLAVPVFITAVAAVWLISKLSGRKGPPLVRLLLALHLMLLTTVWVLSLLEHPALKPAGLRAGVEAMIAVSAMACQFTLLQIGIPGAPSTAVMTGNMTNSVLSLLELLTPGEPIEKLDNGRPTRSLELIGCFFAGCLAGAAACSWIGEWAWSLPVALAGVALAISR
jgi:uncharacterized membrane protein YoaK (UPF0700 family)